MKPAGDTAAEKFARLLAAGTAYVTVRDLIRELEKFDGDRLVVMSKDAEGNGYSPLAKDHCAAALYRADSTWSGEIDHPDNPWEESEGVVRALVLWPIN